MVVCAFAGGAPIVSAKRPATAALVASSRSSRFGLMLRCVHVSDLTSRFFHSSPGELADRAQFGPLRCRRKSPVLTNFEAFEWSRCQAPVALPRREEQVPLTHSQRLIAAKDESRPASVWISQNAADLLDNDGCARRCLTGQRSFHVDLEHAYRQAGSISCGPGSAKRVLRTCFLQFRHPPNEHSGTGRNERAQVAGVARRPARRDVNDRYIAFFVRMSRLRRDRVARRGIRAAAASKDEEAQCGGSQNEQPAKIGASLSFHPGRSLHTTMASGTVRSPRHRNYFSRKTLSPSPLLRNPVRLAYGTGAK
jgi:hypothetical protein